MLVANLRTTITDVPPNGDCSYNVIQLFLTTLNAISFYPFFTTITQTINHTL